MGGTGIVKISAHSITVGRQDFLPLKDGTYVAVAVTDEGKGIPEALIHTIFDPYFTTKTNAAGLGLATAYALVKKHDGCIAVDSKEGHGPTFTIYLPAVQSDDLEQSEQGTPTSTSTMAGQGRVLLMDDEEYIRTGTSKLLSILGYTVATARSGDEAVEIYRNALSVDTPFDVVILDLTVSGGMGGREAIEKLIAINPQVLAIVSSGYVNDPVMVNHTQFGFRAAISKPYEIEELSEKLQHILRKG